MLLIVKNKTTFEIMKQNSKIWYSFMGDKNFKNDVTFYNLNEILWADDIQENWNTIRDEINLYIVNNEKNIKSYFNKSLITKKSNWRISTFLFWNWKLKKNIKQCPYTISLFNKIPGIISISISILEGNSEIKLHRGDTNATIRGHLALKIPEKLPICGFKVSDEERSWEEGKILLFNDASKHTAWNYSSERRYILLFDIIKPEFIHKKYNISSIVLAGMIMQIITKKIFFLNKLPNIIFEIILYTIAIPINLLLRIQSYR